MNNSRSHLQSFINNSLAIRQEIQRFESVHPSIYAIYDLIELIPDNQIAQQLRDHVVCIEGKTFLFFNYLILSENRFFADIVGVFLFLFSFH